MVSPNPNDSAEPSSREQRIGSGVAVTARWTGYLLVLALGAAALGLVVMLTWSILLPVVLAVLLCTVLHPISSLLVRVGAPRAVAAGGALTIALLIAAGLVTLVIPTVAPQVIDLADSASKGLDDVRRFLRDGPFGVSDANFDEAVTSVQQRLRNSADMVAQGLLVTLGAITGFLVNLILTIVLAFLFLKDGHRFLPWIRGTAGARAGHHLSEVLGRLWVAISGFVRAQALVGLMDALFIGIGLLIIGVPLAAPLALLTFVAAFAPIVGAVTVGGLAVLVALVSNGWVTALIVLALVIAVQQFEGNVLLPWLQGRSLGLHAAVVLLAIVLGSTLFGVTGAFLSVPVVASLAVVLTYLNEVASQGSDGPAGEGSAD